MDNVKSGFKSIAEQGNCSKYSQSVEVEFDHIYTSDAVSFDKTNIDTVKKVP